MRLLAAAAVAALFSLSPSASQAQYAGTAVGSLVIDGRTIPLKYAYAVDVDNVEEAGLQMAGPRKSLVIVLTDRALPRASVSNRMAPFAERLSPAQYMAPTHKGPAYSAYGIVLKIDPAKANPLGADLLFPNNDSIDLSVTGTEYPDRVAGLKRVGDMLTGTARVAAMVETHREKGPKRYRYLATFRAPLLHEDPVTRTLEGAEALNSAQIKALRSYLEAGKTGDVATLKSLTAPTHLSYTSNKEFLDSLKSGDMSKLPEQVKRVVVRGDSATVVVVSTEPTYSQVFMHLVRDQGAWKLCWP